MKLRTALAQYLRLKQSLGFRFHAESVILRAFARAMGPIDLGRVTPARVRHYLDGQGPLTRFWERKWVSLRGFYRFTLARGLVRRSPVPAAAPKLPPRFVPYIYSREELQRLLAAIPTEPLAGLSASTLRTLLLLLYGAGLRTSEALTLTEEDVQADTRLLWIRQSKFFKSRWVPVGRPLAKVLARYRQQRPVRQSDQRQAFFQTVGGFPVNRAAVERAFRVLRQTAGVQRTDGTRYQPRLHDLRHSFAVHRLVAWYRQGANVSRLLPKLSTFLGHIDLAATQHYLTSKMRGLRRRQQNRIDFAGSAGIFGLVSITSQNVSLLTPAPERRFARADHAKGPANIGVFVRGRGPDTLRRSLPDSAIL